MELSTLPVTACQAARACMAVIGAVAAVLPVEKPPVD
jgi:hypothetical protein